VIFIDTSAFLARYLPHDQHHSAAVEYWEKLGKDNAMCSTSNFVLDELLSLLVRRASGNFAAKRARHLYASNLLQILRPNEADETAAVILLEKYADHRVSFTDCVSFVLMQRLGIADVFTFDSHFDLAGFNQLP